jgi:4a-hydroxytetrahydrobiopterin dehydratase
MAKLTAEAVQAALKKLPGWNLKDEAIDKQYTWPSFPDAIKFVNQVADLAEQADHHPDILINYRRVTLTLSTHSEGGITQKDFDLAEQIDRACRPK